MFPLDRKRARQDACVRVEKLKIQIRDSGATPAQKAYMEQALVHLWQSAEEAIDAPEACVYPTLMTNVGKDKT